MRFSALASVAVFFHAALILICGDAFVISKSSVRRAAALSESRRSALHAALTDQLERIVEGPVVDLRGGAKKADKSSSSKGKSPKPSKSKSKKETKKPSFFATIKAFFKSLIDPHFALKLEAKNEKHNTVHGSGKA